MSRRKCLIIDSHIGENCKITTQSKRSYLGSNSKTHAGYVGVLLLLKMFYWIVLTANLNLDMFKHI